MAYRLYLSDIKTIENSDRLESISKDQREREKFFYPSVTPLKFFLSGKLKDHFKIEELDSLLCSYKNKHEFLSELKKHNLAYLSEQERNSEELTLSYRQGKTTKERTIIYDDLLLYEQAIITRNRKTKQKATEEGDPQRLTRYIQFIKSLALNKTTRPFILYPEKIKYLDFDSREKLSPNIFFDYDTGNNIIPGVRTLLTRYIVAKENYEENYNRHLSTLNEEKQLRIANEQLNRFFQNSYQNLRKMIEWEIDYKEVLTNCLTKKELTNARKEIIKLQLRRLDIAKKYRNQSDPLFNTNIYDIDEEEEYTAYSDLSSIEPVFTNQEIADLYHIGGKQAVMENMDLDDIFRYEGDAVKLGLIYQDKNKK